MGSSKKSKDKDKTREERKEKKRKRRSRSGSREKDPERKHHHRHHHKHKKQRSKRREDRSRSVSPSFSEDSLSDVEQLLQLKDEGQYMSRAGAGLPPPPKNSALPSSRFSAPPPPKISKRSPSPPSTLFQGGGGGGDVSLSIDETNKIRAKLGLKPLKVDSMPIKEDDDQGADGEDREEKSASSKLDEFVHKPAESITQKLQVEKLREKIAAQREKRRIKERFQKVKNLGDSDSEEESARVWVKKSRKLTKERELAEKKSKMLEELDAQFGIGDLVEADMTEQKVKKYSYNDLSGLQVQHEFTRFDTGGPTILTLKDSNVLDGAEDTLINVNIVDDERAEKNLKRKKKKLDEVEYEAPEVDEWGNIVQRTLLTKYDEEIEGEKKKSFRLGIGGGALAYDEMVPEAVRKIAKLRKLQNLETPQSQLATEYLTESEMVSFRKVKKTKKKKKKKLTADDLEPIAEESLVHLGTRNARQARLEALQVIDDDISDGGQDQNTLNVGRTQTLRDLLEEEEEKVKMEIDDVEEGNESEQDDVELQEALARSRRAKIAQASQPSTDKILDLMKEKQAKIEEEPMEEDDDDAGLVMTLNTTDEFCRTLGDLPTYGLSGNRADDDQTMLQLQQPREKEAQEPRGAWEEVGIDDTRVEISDSMTVPILEEEPDASKGVANALKLALKKGYLEKTNVTKSANAALQHLRAVHYSIEDKAVDDERGRGRGERYMGPVTEFKDKDSYKPDVKLEYVDDEGRKLNAKEAFRYLSHKFHGKGSGKNKTEKRMKKWNEELLMKHMSSSDTPLQTLERQREKQKQLGAAYLVLSGSKTQETMEVKK
ncbi:U4/U6.U5 tri-snRNP-associated protein 1-like [Homarus americanus]|uniref:U4/U6.U5 tri-snRNP-associated protein 1-like n=1 Tax=Homarus americanus TaxID=6706 RepID=A0A8J5JB40_HOMAM|nr:U4/U6.U5 tri-snRNP-associated protein 1-like [Homarus americanus]KAG7154951.1 U4/U6.U5 tri-snRNP-associated protein 1-like [Homarus americanus]